MWLNSGSNSGLRGGKPTTNRLSYGTAFHVNIPLVLLLGPEDRDSVSSESTDFHRTALHYVTEGKKPSPLPLCPPEIGRDLTWARSPGRHRCWLRACLSCKIMRHHDIVCNENWEWCSHCYGLWNKHVTALLLVLARSEPFQTPE
jgi:hypothetical protein